MAKKKPSRSRREKQLQQQRLHRQLLRRIYDLFRRHKTDPKGENEWAVRLARLSGNRRLCRRLEVHHSVVGIAHPATQTIWIDVSSELVKTFVHECFHVVLERKYEDHNDKEETGVERVEEEAEVTRLENFVMSRLTARQAKNLLLLLMRVSSTSRK